MRSILKTFIYFFILLGVVFIPMESYVIPIQGELAIWVFGDLANLLVEDHLAFSSDTLGLNVLIFFLLLLALIISFFLSPTKYWSEKKTKILHIISLIGVYYLSSRLLIYGFDKVFQTQFYTPEPNILYTPFGFLSKDILFWSTMGTSTWYCVLSGLAEIIPAVLLLFRKTRVAGLLLTLFVLLHVLVINIGFDISVKLYSTFLLLITLVLIAPYYKSLIAFFFKEEAVRIKVLPITFVNHHWRKSLKFFVVGMMLIEALKFPISTGYLSDDRYPRPYLHGAYEVVDIEETEHEDTLVSSTIKRIFVHRRGFLILQYADDRTEDFQLNIDREQEVFEVQSMDGELKKLPYRVDKTETILKLGDYTYDDQLVWIVSERLNWEALPALQDEFHWTIDEFKVDGNH
ncbi:MAG: hypothetical protein HUJ25_03280 [Crocinitomicaceae bacterium]|nr:hypothetical protein [Crocinitomicaceae bacterium]